MQRPLITNRSGVSTIALIGAAAISPFLLVHALYLGFVASEPNLAEVIQSRLDTHLGFDLAYYANKILQPELEIVFVHGTPGDARAFREQFKKPLSGARLIAVDRPGFGASGGERPDPSLAFQVQALRPLLERDPGVPRFLVGHSYGGPVVVQAAVDRVGRIDGLLLIGASLDPGQEEVLGIQRFGNLWPVAFLLPSALRVANRELITLRYDLELLAERFSQIDVPVVMLHGDEDPLVPVENVAFVQRALERVGKLRIFHKETYPEYDHFIPWEHPEAVEKSLNYLRQRTSPGASFRSRGPVQK